MKSPNSGCTVKAFCALTLSDALKEVVAEIQSYSKDDLTAKLEEHTNEFSTAVDELVEFVKEYNE